MMRSESRYLSVWDGFRYTDVEREPSSLRSNNTYRNGKHLFEFSTSCVNWIELLRCSRNADILKWWLQYRHHQHSVSRKQVLMKMFLLYVFHDKVSHHNWTGEPIAVRYTCLYITLRKENKWHWGTAIAIINWQCSSVIKGTSFSRRKWTICRARSTGILVNKEITSKDTKHSFFKQTLCAKDTNSLESRTVWEVFLTKGDKIPTRCLKGGKLVKYKDTIGLKGTPDLWIFGRPYRDGLDPDEHLSLL